MKGVNWVFEDGSHLRSVMIDGEVLEKDRHNIIQWLQELPARVDSQDHEVAFSAGRSHIVEQDFIELQHALSPSEIEGIRQRQTTRVLDRDCVPARDVIAHLKKRIHERASI